MRSAHSEALMSSAVCESPRQMTWRTGRLGVSASLAVAAVVAVLASVVNRTDDMLGAQLAVQPQADELVYLPPTRFLKAVALGYEHALADVLWFRTINYFGRHYRSDRVYPWLASMCDVVTDLDPRAEHVYRFGGVLLPWEANRVDDGIALLEKGARNIPESWQILYMLGFSYYFFKADIAAASDRLSQAARVPDAPAFISGLTALMHAAQYGPDSAIAFLNELDRRGGDDEMRGFIRERIRELSLTRDITAVDAAIQRFEAHFHRRPAQLDELVSTGMIAAIPAEPYGGHYRLDPVTGAVESSEGHKPRRLGSSEVREGFLHAKRPEAMP
jgi:hypothetical protein